MPGTHGRRQLREVEPRAPREAREREHERCVQFRPLLSPASVKGCAALREMLSTKLVPKLTSCIPSGLAGQDKGLRFWCAHTPFSSSCPKKHCSPLSPHTGTFDVRRSCPLPLRPPRS